MAGGAAACRHLLIGAKNKEQRVMRSVNLKTALVVILGIALCATAFAQDQEIRVTGYAKSGILWYNIRENGKDEVIEEVRLGSTDDAGINTRNFNQSQGQGRFRMDIEYTNKNMGIKTRVEWDQLNSVSPAWKYAFAYGNFFDDQLTFSVGKLGASPWGTGGPEMWKELEAGVNGGTPGMRTEWKPAFIPGLNVGFVLNYWNSGLDNGGGKRTLLEILRESVLGISYTHDLFLVRFAYRFDGECDILGSNPQKTGEDSLLYRVEERVLKNYLPGFQIWALGYFEGLYVEDKAYQLLQNWLFAQYEPEQFTAQIRFGFDVGDRRNVLHIRPSFYYKLFDNLLNVGVSFWYGQDFGEGKMYPGSPFQFIELEPKIQLNFGSSYVAFVYNFRREYGHEVTPGVEPIKQIQWMNLRFCMQM